MDNKSWRRGQGKGTLLVGFRTCPGTLEIGVEGPQKAKNKSTIRPSYTTPWLK